ncbi:hypothetical protein JCM11491_004156 [Sporobolomyces phaffii]
MVSRSSSSSSSSSSVESSGLFRHSTDSLGDSVSTAPTFSSSRPRQSSGGVQLPSLKASLIHLPLELPAPPEPLPEAGDRLVLDEDLENAPVGFVIHRMRSLGPALLKSTTETCLFIPPGPSLPQYLRCTLPRPSSLDSAAVSQPSHILGIRSSDSPRTLLLPVHGLLYASASPPLSILSSEPERQPPHPSLPTVPRPDLDAEQARVERLADLPIVEVNVPSSAAFPHLQGWIYLRSPSLLLSSLLPPLPPSHPTPNPPPPPSSLSRILNPTPSPTTTVSPTPSSLSPSPSPEELAVSLSKLASSVLLHHIHLVHGLWGNAVCLQVSDEGLWKTMSAAWKILVAALALKESERRRG